MRIAGYIPHPVLKITIFQMENRFAVKFEDATLEQTYKFRLGNGIDSIADIHQLISQDYIQEVQKLLSSMRSLQNEQIKALQNTNEEDEFDDII
jgi:hypothetical protein